MMTNSYNRNRLFLASCIALITTSVSFAVRARLEPIFGAQFDLTPEQLGFAFAPAFWGFTLAMIIGGPLVDQFGMKRIVWLAFFSHLVGIILTILATNFWTLFLGTLGIGIGNGMVEAACNPLVASVYPKEKTKMLNRFHIWFPGGIVIGSLIGYFMIDQLNIGWQLYVAILFIPLIIYGILFFGQTFPQTERVQMGITSGEMWKSVAKPLFIFMIFCMFLTAATELGTNQRIETLLTGTGVSGILVLAFINGIMAIGRGFAGPMVHRLNPTGMLLFSAIFSFLGLMWLSFATGYTTFAAAAVFAIGICYFWPTMIGYVAEYLPQTGALGLALMGGAGMLSVSIVLPIMGIFIGDAGGAKTLQIMSILPGILIILFAFLYFYTHKKLDVKAEATNPEEAPVR